MVIPFRTYNYLRFSIHNYFAAKMIDQVRPGGITAFVTSRYMMDSKNSAVRAYLAERAMLLGAIRLPNDAFKTNTSVVTDILFFQRREHPVQEKPDWLYLDKTEDGITLKECYMVRYADDFKIFCKNRADAVKLFEATKQWLKDRLGLEISPEKSKIVNLKRHFSEFLGFKLKVRIKGKKPNGQPRYVIEAHMKEKALKKIHDKSKEIIGKIRQTYDKRMEYGLIQRYNSYIVGVHNYYCIATHVNLDFQTIAFDVKKSLYNRLKHRLQKAESICLIVLIVLKITVDGKPCDGKLSRTVWGGGKP